MSDREDKYYGWHYCKAHGSRYLTSCYQCDREAGVDMWNEGRLVLKVEYEIAYWTDGEIADHIQKVLDREFRNKASVKRVDVEDWL